MKRAAIQIVTPFILELPQTFYFINYSHKRVIVRGENKYWNLGRHTKDVKRRMKRHPFVWHEGENSGKG